MSDSLTPLTDKRRIHYLDILRGIAIFFIFIANVYLFSGWSFYPESMKQEIDGYQFNVIIEYFTDFFVEGKFYSIFSILLGIGFVIQYINLNKKNKPFVPFFQRRMAGLFIIGIIHLFFLWVGDILALYAFLGFLLVYFRDMGNRKILTFAVVLLFMPLLNYIFMHVTGIHYPGSFYGAFNKYMAWLNLSNLNDAGGFNDLDLIHTEKIGDFFKSTIGMPLIRVARILNDGKAFNVFACFLIGIWAGRRIYYQHLLQDIKFLRKIAIWGFALGIPMNILKVYTQPFDESYWIALNYLSRSLGVVPMACAYAASVALLLRKERALLRLFDPVGHLALTNYLSQTVISIILFYHIGFGLSGKLALWQIMILVIILFALQIAFSIYWLKYFKYGPVEWIWRQFTYGRYINNSKKPNQA